MASDWVQLFNGRDLSGWKTTGNPQGWTVDNGCILCRAEKGGYLYTEAQFTDFDLELEFCLDPGCNSGVFFGWSDLADPVHTGLEIQILDTYGKPLDKHSCGALYDLVPPTVDAARPAGEWNTMLLACAGPAVQVRLNGHQVLDVDIDQFDTAGQSPDGTANKFKYAWKDMPRTGHIGLQDHNGRLWFRNLRLRTR